ncbi:F-box domain-containing protein [Artemisia annua]|uniref:F-box domain-containing protein n=1 Tax=Artemisia annua TaxID=35608 RepID=A0A2U1LI16_ARTAN|nr:F-box domain-containing protein [Artemisia annua]
MADVYMGDDQTLASISTRLPATTPKAGRAIFFLPNNTSVPVDDHKEQYSTVKLCMPLRFEENRDVVTIVGTYCGIVLLHVHVKNTSDTNKTGFSHIVLYNPCTGMSRSVRDPNSLSCSVYGFGYGKNPSDFKIVRLRKTTYKSSKCTPGVVSMFYPNSILVNSYCDVLTLKSSTWITTEISLDQDAIFCEDNKLGTFLNGVLYWFASTNIVALSVSDLVTSKINLPNPHSYTNTHLGTWHGYLCMITDTNNLLDSGHDLWILKICSVNKSWTKECSFTLGLGVDHITQYRILNIMGDGRILMVDTSSNLIIYHISNRSYKKLNTSGSVIDFRIVSGIEYVKSRVSPSELC